MYIYVYIYIYIYIHIYIHTYIHTFTHTINIIYIHIHICVGGVEIDSRVQVVSRLWKYIKEHDLQDPNAKQFIDLDANMKAVFGTDRFSMFVMSKELSNHLSNIPVADSN
jgi:hypothetical protein